jgi:hypothetical protein
MIGEQDVERVVAPARGLPERRGVCVENDFVLNLLETVLGYMLQTTVVVKSLELLDGGAAVGESAA